MSESTFDPIEPILGEFHVVDADFVDGHRAPTAIRFEPQGLFAHSVARVDDASEVYGLAALFRGRLLLATGPRDKVEIGAYCRSGEKLVGIWVPPGAKGCDLAFCGRELSHRVGDCTFQIDDAHAVDQMPYTGRLTLDYVDDDSHAVRRVKFNWSLHDGEYSSFGLASGEILVSSFNFEPSQAFAIGLFEPRGNKWQGTIAHSDAAGVSRAVLRR